MIGVQADTADPRIVAEFFELFKTPWERAVPGRKYGAIVAVGGRIDHLDAALIVSYTGSPKAPHSRQEPGRGATTTFWGDVELPIYGPLATFPREHGTTVVGPGERAVDCRVAMGGRVVWQVGYDLFDEVAFLLTTGQPIEQAAVPALDVHIDLLRHLLVQGNVSFVEVPPRPRGFDFTCCLTHDVDFFGIARHKADHTLAGFLGRATLGSVRDLANGRRTAGEAARNVSAALSLPLIFSGLARDFWQPFEDYSRVENGDRSTFFLVPFSGRAGRAPDGRVDATRAVRYQISEIRHEALEAAGRGVELAVHGIDAWLDADAGRRELTELTTVTGRATAGVRMHWLYFDSSSGRRLEEAGFAYDSTWGYNDAVGYRAGTSQVFRLDGTNDLMELPLSIMDSALLSPGRLGLDAAQAAERWRPIIENAQARGGTIVVNWHGRSLAPERLWGRHYRRLLDEIASGHRVWFTTAGQAVRWFRWRRAVQFKTEAGRVTVTTPSPEVPGGVVRVHRGGARAGAPVELEIGTAARHLAIELPLPPQPLPVSSSIH